jgi:hypothetical protein
MGHHHNLPLNFFFKRLFSYYENKTKNISILENISTRKNIKLINIIIPPMIFLLSHENHVFINQIHINY